MFFAYFCLKIVKKMSQKILTKCGVILYNEERINMGAFGKNWRTGIRYDFFVINIQSA